MLITTDDGQSAYISGTEFHDRCLREMGHLPGTLGTATLGVRPGVHAVGAGAARRRERSARSVSRAMTTAGGGDAALVTVL